MIFFFFFFFFFFFLFYFYLIVINFISVGLKDLVINVVVVKTPLYTVLINMVNGVMKMMTGVVFLEKMRYELNIFIYIYYIIFIYIF